MKNIEQFLILLSKRGIIDAENVVPLIDLFDSKFPNSDLLKKSVHLSLLDKVLTFSEAQILYDIAHSTLSKNIKYNRYLDGEVRKSGKAWLISLDALERLYKDKKKYSLKFDSYINLCIEEGLISSNRKDDIEKVFNEEFSGSDVYSMKSLKEYLNDINYSINSSLENVLTFSEATSEFNLSEKTLRNNIDYGKYLPGEVRQSKGIWLITRAALNRLYGNK